jgi:hypothetical protein
MVDNTEDPNEYLNQQRKGIRSACRRFSYLLTGALLSQGVNARVVSIAADFDRDSLLVHNVVEAWVPKLNKWIVLDPTHDAFVLVDGAMASALEIHAADRPESLKTVSFDQHGCHHHMPKMEDYRRSYRHVFVSRTNAVFDGYRYGLFATKQITFAHYCEPGVEPFPQQKKRVLLSGFAASSSIATFLVIDLAILLTVRLKDYKERIARAVETCANETEELICCPGGPPVALPTFACQVRVTASENSCTRNRFKRRPPDLPLTGSGRAGPSSELTAIKWPVFARILRAFSRDPEAPDFGGGTIKHVGKHALDFLRVEEPR